MENKRIIAYQKKGQRYEIYYNLTNKKLVVYCDKEILDKQSQKKIIKKLKSKILMAIISLGMTGVVITSVNQYKKAYYADLDFPPLIAEVITDEGVFPETTALSNVDIVSTIEKYNLFHLEKYIMADADRFNAYAVAIENMQLSEEEKAVSYNLYELCYDLRVQIDFDFLIQKLKNCSVTYSAMDITESGNITYLYDESNDRVNTFINVNTDNSIEAQKDAFLHELIHLITANKKRYTMDYQKIVFDTNTQQYVVENVPATSDRVGNVTDQLGEYLVNSLLVEYLPEDGIIQNNNLEMALGGIFIKVFGKETLLSAFNSEEGKATFYNYLLSLGFSAGEIELYIDNMTEICSYYKGDESTYSDEELAVKYGQILDFMITAYCYKNNLPLNTVINDDALLLDGNMFVRNNNLFRSNSEVVISQMTNQDYFNQINDDDFAYNRYGDIIDASQLEGFELTYYLNYEFRTAKKGEEPVLLVRSISDGNVEISTYSLDRSVNLS